MVKKKTKRASVTLMMHVATTANCKSTKDIWLEPNQIFEVKIDYPLSHPAKFKLRTGKDGMGIFGIATAICKKYQEIYDEEDERGEDEDGDTKYGIWGHDIEDLHLEGININFEKKTITIDVGS